jgi:hypothetical protein
MEIAMYTAAKRIGPVRPGVPAPCALVLLSALIGCTSGGDRLAGLRSDPGSLRAVIAEHADPGARRDIEAFLEEKAGREAFFREYASLALEALSTGAGGPTGLADKRFLILYTTAEGALRVAGRWDYFELPTPPDFTWGAVAQESDLRGPAAARLRGFAALARRLLGPPVDLGEGLAARMVEAGELRADPRYEAVLAHDEAWGGPLAPGDVVCLYERPGDAAAEGADG